MHRCCSFNCFAVRSTPVCSHSAAILARHTHTCASRCSLHVMIGFFSSLRRLSRPEHDVTVSCTQLREFCWNICQMTYPPQYFSCTLCVWLRLLVRRHRQGASGHICAFRNSPSTEGIPTVRSVRPRTCPGPDDNIRGSTF